MDIALEHAEKFPSNDYAVSHKFEYVCLDFSVKKQTRSAISKAVNKLIFRACARIEASKYPTVCLAIKVIEIQMS